MCYTTGILVGDITEEDKKAWKHLWTQLQVVNGIFYIVIFLNLQTDVTRKVLVVQKSFIQTILHMCHDVPGAGHQGFNKTLARVQEELTAWV